MSAYEHCARERKARAIASAALATWRKVLAEYDVPEDRYALASFLVNLANADDWELWCYVTNAGQKKPSARTWLRVIATVANSSTEAQSRAAA